MTALQAKVTILGIFGLSIFSSCQASHTPPTKLLPAYSIDISYLLQTDKISVKQGGSFTLPMKVDSLVDQSLYIRFVLTGNNGEVPYFLQYDEPQGFLLLEPRSTIAAQITIRVTDDALLGDYIVGVHGQLQEPVNERSTMTQFFNLIITR